LLLIGVVFFGLCLSHFLKLFFIFYLHYSKHPLYLCRCLFIQSKPKKMKDLQNLSNLLNQRFTGDFVYEKEINSILYFSSRYTIEINLHKKTDEICLHVQDYFGHYDFLRFQEEQILFFHLNYFVNN